MGKNQESAKAIVKGVGGVNNIKMLTHCATRLRFTLGSTDKVEFYASGSEKYVAVLNGKTMGNCYKADVTRVQKEVKEVIK